MRILFLALDIDLSKWRGDTIHAAELVCAWSDLGHQVAIIVGADGPVRRLIPSQVLISVAGVSPLSVLASIRRLLRTFPIDVIYERRYTPKVGYLVHLMAKVPYVMEVNGVLKDELVFQKRLLSRPRRLKGFVRTVLMRRVDRFVAVSHAVAEDLILTYRISPSKVRVIGNGANPDRFRPMTKDEAAEELGFDPSRPRLVFVGNIVPWRDFDVMLDAMGYLSGFPLLELVIAGSGQSSDELETRVGSLGLDRRVKLLGEIPYDQVPYVIASADVCLLPARSWHVDISPLKLFEYLASGRPVVASRVPGTEIIEERGVGRLFQPGDAKDLALVVSELLQNPSVRQEMGVCGREFVENERSWTAIASRVVSVLQEASGLVATVPERTAQVVME